MLRSDGIAGAGCDGFSPRDPNRFLRRPVRGARARRRECRPGARALRSATASTCRRIEPIPDVFAALAANIARYPRQRALECLVTDRDDAPYEFNVANNGGESSSILALKEHRDVWPKVDFTKTITLRSSTLATLLARERIDPQRYDA